MTPDDLRSTVEVGGHPAPDAAALAQFTPGQTLLERFQIVRFIGRGGMGEVYEARDLELSRIALKTIRAEIAADPNMLARFKQEVQYARMVSGSHVCRIHELHIIPAKGAQSVSAFLTMEFLDGQTLAERIDSSSLFPLNEANAIATQICAGLRSIHEAGLVHRDLKSQNVMLAQRNGALQAVITDFGLARQSVISAQANSAATRVGAIIGTPAYMAPEQLEGKPASPLSDIYSLGLIFYEILTGKLPFDADTIAGAAAQRARPIALPSSVRPEITKQWDRVIAKCLVYAPAQRFQTVAEIESALAGSRPSLATKRPPFKLTIPLILAVLLLCVAAATVWFINRPVSHVISTAALTFYNKGLAALYDGTYVRATNLLNEAVAADPNFALAHARLADAYNTIDYNSKAADQLLLALNSPIASALDRKYIEAINKSIIRDFPSALRIYRDLLDRLPDQDKADGYLDLGRVYEDQSDIPNAIKAYREAASRNSSDPAPFVRLGVLESRQKQMSIATADFANAEKLYQNSNDQEGLAEILYQKGYSAYLERDLKTARAYLEQSQRIAEELSLTPLKVKTLCALSTTELLARNTQISSDLANKAIQLAQSNHLDYWATVGVIRLGTLNMVNGDYAKADSLFNQGMQLAKDSERPRLLAIAQLNLASLRDRQDRPDEAIAQARPALAFFQKGGFSTSTMEALTVIARSEERQGKVQDALSSALDLLKLAHTLNSKPSLMLAEGTTELVLASLERYPEAYIHSQSALTLSRELESPKVSDFTFDQANILWHLGRYRDAAQLLASLSGQAELKQDVALLNAQIMLSQLRYRDSSRLASAVIASHDTSAATLVDARIVAAVANARSGAQPSAEKDCAAALTGAQANKDDSQFAAAQASCAIVYLSAKSPTKANPFAEAADRYFLSSGRKESAWFNQASLAEIFRLVGARASAKRSSAQALGILNEFREQWPPADFQSYLSRPDIQEEQRQMVALSRE